MNYLIDTNIFLWWMEENKRLSQDLFTIISNPTNKIFLSVVSIWEIIIKKNKKNFKFPKDLEAVIETSRFELLTIGITHVLRIGRLPLYHKDPFDRILIAQAIVENLTLITSDEKIWKYKTSLIKV